MTELESLKQEVARLRAALEEVVFSNRTKISMKQAATRALWPETYTPKTETPATN